ncbi:uncharacterized protein LOC125775831 [Bactrocera dorsalis]|uniref:Uncharacterized protein LOC125775831 n=1 Tax=Bactrocera dorsalis TaxID=27457 RepID=A0ABM3J0I3_BACDO|nr:uncharacterized protein LOC125775831 [Bactrocera dorsalis]
MALDIFALCARFNYRLIRYFFFTKLYYNKSTQRLEIRARNRYFRRSIQYVMNFTVAAYAFVLIAIPLGTFMKYRRRSQQFSDVELFTIYYISVIFIVHISSLATIFYQMQCKQTSKFLKRFFNQFFEIQANISQLCGQNQGKLETRRFLLLLFKFIVLLVALIASTRTFQIVLVNIFNFPLFELVYIANYMMILRLLMLQEDLIRSIKQQAEKQMASETSDCTDACQRISEALRDALALRRRSEKLLMSFLAYFGWFEKLLVLDNILCVYLTKQFIVCVIYQGAVSGALVPVVIKYILNLLLIGTISDTFTDLEAKLNTYLTILVATLSRRPQICAECADLKRVVSKDVFIK